MDNFGEASGKWPISGSVCVFLINAVKVMAEVLFEDSI